MESRKSFLAILTLVLAGTLVFPSDYVDAKKTKKSSSKKSSKKKKTKTTKTTSSTSSETSEERASTSTSTSRRTTSSSTTSSSSSSSKVDEATEISNLKSNLLSCLSGQCAGDISYEKCFKTSNVDVFLAGNSTCQSYLNSASSETVRVLAKQQVVSKIKEYFTESCNQAGGKVSGETCKLDIYYYAKSPDGKHSKKANKSNVSVGTTFTCSYANFGLNQSDLEYKLGQSTEDKIQNMQAAIQIGTGLLNTGMQIFSAVKASKDLKRAGAFVEDAWYKFDGNTLEPKQVDNDYYYGGSGAGVKKDLYDTCSGRGVDDNGAKFCKYRHGGTCSEENNTCDIVAGKSNAPGTDCSTVQKVTSSNPCYIYIEKSNEIKKGEKLSELIRTKGNLDELKQNAVKEQNKNALKQMMVQGATAQIFNSVANQGLSFGGGAQICKEAMTTYVNGETCTFGSKKSINSTADAVICAKSTDNFGASPTCNVYSKNGATYYVCLKTGANCTWDPSQNNYIKQVSNSNGLVNRDGNPCGDVYKDGECMSTTAWNMTSQISVMEGNMNGAITAIDTLSNSIKTDEQDKYNKTLTAYTTNQNSLNTKKKEMEELREQNSSALQGAISSGTQTLLTGATTLITTSLSAENNKDIMTGACYLGDPSNGNMIMQEGEVKKLTWKFFN
ncbi:MAG: hypothetical protein K6F04_01150 [bacterium]|nr:hypothetical protein [bacterium]